MYKLLLKNLAQLNKYLLFHCVLEVNSQVDVQLKYGHFLLNRSKIK